MKSYLLEAEDLITGYDGVPLSGKISFRAGSGNLVFLAGHNGSGKSTLLKTLAALLEPVGGRIFLNNKNLASFKRKEIAKLISVSLTEGSFFSSLTVREIVSAGRYPYTPWNNIMSEEDIKAVDAAEEAMGISSLEDRFFDTLSDGEKQKTIISKALAQETPLIIMDEPVSHLDPAAAVEILLYLRNAAQENNKLIIISSHSIREAADYGDMLMIFGRDRAFLSGYPEDMLCENIFDSMFKNKNIIFDSEKCSFGPAERPVKDLCLKYEKNIKEDILKWTVHALNKTGFSIKSGAEESVFITKKEGAAVWGTGGRSFASIGALCSFLKERQRNVSKE